MVLSSFPPNEAKTVTMSYVRAKIKQKQMANKRATEKPFPHLIKILREKVQKMVNCPSQCPRICETLGSNLTPHFGLALKLFPPSNLLASLPHQATLKVYPEGWEVTIKRRGAAAERKSCPPIHRSVIHLHKQNSECHSFIATYTFPKLIFSLCTI